MDKANGGNRVIFVDSLISDEDEDEDVDSPEPVNRKRLHLCGFIGCAHNYEFSRCEHCSSVEQSVPLWAIRQKEKAVGYLRSCLCCKSTGKEFGGRMREPAKPVRATNVADVHVLAQNVVHHAEKKKTVGVCR